MKSSLEFTSFAHALPTLVPFRKQVSNLTHDMPRVDEVLAYGIEHQFFMAEELGALVSDRDLKEYEQFNKPPPGLPKAARIAASAKRIIAKWRASDGVKKTRLFPKLHTRISKVSPETGTPIKLALVREGFAEAVLAPHGKAEFDQEDIVCFADRWCWCGATATWRRIVPADMATKHVGYDRPHFDAQRRKLLEGYLLDIHGDIDIVMWRLGLKAQALRKGQAGPICLASQGAAGGCKSLEVCFSTHP